MRSAERTPIDPDGTTGGDPATTEYFVYDTTSNVLAPLDPRVGAFPSALTPAEDYGQIVLRIDATGTPTHRYLWAPGVDRIIADEEVTDGSAEDIVWTLADHQNSVRDLARYNTTTGLTTVEEHPRLRRPRQAAVRVRRRRRPRQHRPPLRRSHRLA